MDAERDERASASKVDAVEFFKRLGLSRADERPIMEPWKAANAEWRRQRREQIAAHRRRIHSHLRRYAGRSSPSAENPNTQGRSKPVWCVELKRPFSSMSSAAAFLGRQASNISQSLDRGVRCGPYHWEIYDPARHGPGSS